MSGGQKQCCRGSCSILGEQDHFLDEPTAALGVVQTQNVLDLIKRVRDKGIGVVFISHSMPEVLGVADRVQFCAVVDASRLTKRQTLTRRTRRCHDGCVG